MNHPKTRALELRTVLVAVLCGAIFSACGETTQKPQRKESGLDATAKSKITDNPEVVVDSTEDIAPDKTNEIVKDPIATTATPTPTPTPVVDTKNFSLGTGGATGLVEVNYADTRALASSYKINAPADAGPNKPYGLHIHLHGDGGGGYRDYPNRLLKDGLIGVTVKAPNTGMTWGRASGVPHANYLNDLIQNELIKKYNVDLTKIYFSGVSGGAYFLSGHYIPMFGKVYQTGAFLMCGGMAPQVAFDTPDFLKKFRIHWQMTAGERADITTSVTAAVRAYQTNLQTAGGDAARQSIETIGPGGHCVFDGVSYTSGIQYMMDLKFNTILK